MIFDGSVAFYLLTCIVCLLFLFTWKNYSEKGHLPPGPLPLPIIGNLHQLDTKDMVKSLKKLSEKYGPVYTLHLGLRRIVVLWGYDAVKTALVDQGEAFSGRGSLPALETVLKDYGVLFTSGSRWKELRRFSIMTLRNFGMGKRSIEERIQEEAQYLITEFRNREELPFDPSLHISNAVSNVTCAVIFGKRFDYQDKNFHALLTILTETVLLLNSLSGQLYNMYPSVMEYMPGPHKKIYQYLTDLEKFVIRRVNTNQETFDPNNPRDFIDCFLIKMEKEKDNPSTEYFMKNLTNTVLALFMAGTETTSTSIRHALLLFLEHPNIQEKVIGEIDLVIGRNRLPSTDDRSKMPYTDAVIHEIQRFSDLVPLGVPHRVTQDTEFKGFLLPKGTEVYPILSSVLWDPVHFTNPQQFNPGHFLDENGSLKKNDAFMPFSAGKRICLGEGLARMELFIFITTILQNFRLKVPSDTKQMDFRPRMTGLIKVPAHLRLEAVPR